MICKWRALDMRGKRIRTSCVGLADFEFNSFRFSEFSELLATWTEQSAEESSKSLGSIGQAPEEMLNCCLVVWRHFSTCWFAYFTYELCKYFVLFCSFLACPFHLLASARKRISANSTDFTYWRLIYIRTWLICIRRDATLKYLELAVEIPPAHRVYCLFSIKSVS